MPNRCPGQISWHYDRTEIIADGVVHAIGVCLGLIGAGTIVVMAVKIERVDVAPILVYVIGLVTMLAFSAAYNMWPVSPVKWVLRRFDHSAIYAPNSRPRASSASASPIDGLTSKVRPKPSEALSGMAREAAPETRARALLAIAQAA